MRCDNAPAPWSRSVLSCHNYKPFLSFACFYKCWPIYNSDARGDRPRMLPDVPELAQAEKVIERLDEPSWDFDVSSFTDCEWIMYLGYE